MERSALASERPLDAEFGENGIVKQLHEWMGAFSLDKLENHMACEKYTFSRNNSK